MSRKPVALAVLSVWLVLGAGCAREAGFSRDVMPILNEHCLSCHKAGGEGFAASGFSVESYDAVMKGTRLGPVVTAGSHASSTLVLLLERKGHPSVNMPKDRPPLPERQIEVIRQWIDQGAKNN